MEELDCIDLLDLQNCLKEGISEIFPSRVWVRAEIASIQAKTGGHCYMDLCQSEGGLLVAKVKAVIWRSRYAIIASKFSSAAGKGLEQGMEVLVNVSVTYSELYGLTLSVYDIEPRFSLGDAALQRRKTIEALEKEGLMDLQKGLCVPSIARRFAVISASDAAGYGDFQRHLHQNEYSFAFLTELFPAAMQGKEAPQSIAAALEAVAPRAEEFDAALILRGGGSALDLACFDDYSLCRAIALCPLPVLTAIGHDRDLHVADMVACDYVKTPTALADRFVDALCAEEQQLLSYSQRLKLCFSQRIASMQQKVELLASRIIAADPRSILSRGYSLVTDSHSVVLKSAAGIRSGESLRLLFADGKINVTVD